MFLLRDEFFVRKSTLPSRRATGERPSNPGPASRLGQHSIDSSEIRERPQTQRWPVLVEEHLKRASDHAERGERRIEVVNSRRGDPRNAAQRGAPKVL